ncbi:putative PAS/PAC sensor protein [Methanosphaerula palustris E1-9c]|uniref:histidine kinase n=2 Tax=Methanosphaerula palustris TaxID=475088 RepID=B8GHR3_METPE|nr:putative PAS/PAC sensor protein [Methanosphaerula palustris E1-9c]
MYRVLYVDDEPALLELGKIFLEMSGFITVETALSAQEGIQVLNRTVFDCIVSDYQMPGMDGLAFLKYLRGEHNGIPFILFTGRGREEVVIEAVNSGVDYYLQKGGDPTSQYVDLQHKIKLSIERRRTEDELKESRQQMTDIIDHLPDATCAVDLDGKIIAWNRAMEEMTGVQKEQILGTGDHSYALPFYGTRRPILLDLILRNDEETWKKYPNTFKEDNKLISEIYIPILYGGKGAYLWFIASPLYDTHGTVIGAIESIRDVTERKRQDHILHTQLDLGLALQSIRGLHDALEICLSAAIEISGMDAGGIYLVDEVHGSLDLAVSRNLGDEFVLSVSHYSADSPNTRIVMTGKPIYIQYKKTGIVHSPVQEQEGLKGLIIIPVMSMGRVIACINISSHIFDEIPANSHIGLETIATQIGAAIVRIQADEALAQSEQKYRNVVEDQTEFISRFLPDGTHVFVNEAYCRYFQKSSAEIIGTTFTPQQPAEDQKAVRQHIRGLTQEKPVATMEHRIVMPDGQIRWQQWSDRAIFDEDGDLVEYQSIGRDITDRKMAEDGLNTAYKQITATEEELREHYDKLKNSGDALRESEEKYRSILENIQDVYYRSDTAGNLILASPSAKQLLGYDLESEVKGKNIAQSLYYYPEEREKFLAELDSRGSVTDYEVTLKKRDGTPVPVSTSSHNYYDANGNRLGVEGIFRDITERKKMEDSLKANEENYRSLVDNLNVGVYRNTPEFPGRTIWANQAFVRILGYDSLPELLEHPVADIYANQDERKKIIQVLDTEGSVRDRELHLKKKDGTQIWVSINAQTKKKSDGTIEWIDGICDDITALKEAEEKGRRYQLEISRTIDYLPDAAFIINRKGTVIAWNRAIEEMTGVRAEEIVGRGDYEYAIPFHGHRRPILIDLIFALEDAVQKGDYVEIKRTGEILSVESPNLILKGKPSIVRAIAAPIYDESGNVAGAIETITDITELKRAQEDLRVSENRYHTIFENTGTATVLLEENTTISLANAEFERLSGYSREEIEGKMSWTEFVFHEDLERMFTQHHLRRERNETALRHYEFRFITKTGEIRSIVLTIDVIPGTTQSVASLMDITAEVRASDAVKLANKHSIS